MLKQAREKSSITSRDLTKFLYQSQNRFNSLKDITNYFHSIYDGNKAWTFYEKGRVQQIEHAIDSLQALLKTKAQFNIDEFPYEYILMLNHDVVGGVSNIMVKPIIEVLGSEEQKKEWLTKLVQYKVVGVYAQTELGHGSDVQSLETEAVYDQNHQEFILNNPTVSSYKWWPGELGVYANIAVVYAKTIINNKKVGVFPFIVQIRDFKTHKLLPGVEAGDIGPKLAYFTKDNGFLKFTNYRIPQKNLLSKFFQITNDNIKIRGNPKIIYASMMKVRIFLLGYSGQYLGKSVGIAIRYSNLRKQFRDDKKQEVPIINYQLQQYKLFRLLAQSYVMIASFWQIFEQIENLYSQVSKGDFSNLQELHIVLSGTKAMFTQQALSGIVTCIQCCGGHGFSEYSGLPSLLGTVFPNTILEGENTVLTLQVGNFLMKCMRYLAEGKEDKIVGHASYLKEFRNLQSFTFEEDVNFLRNVNNFTKLFQKASLTKVFKTAKKMQKLLKKFSQKDMVNKKVGIDLYECCKVHVIATVLNLFEKHSSQQNENVRKVLSKLGNLFAIEQMLLHADLLLETKSISTRLISLAKDVQKNLLDELLPDSLVLAESFIWDERNHQSALANVNEKPYENLYNIAKEFGALNQHDFSQFYAKNVNQFVERLFPKL